MSFCWSRVERTRNPGARQLERRLWVSLRSTQATITTHTAAMASISIKKSGP